MEKLFTAYLSKTLNMDDKQVAELVKTEDGEFKNDALDLLLKQNSSHIETLQSKAKPNEELLTERFNNGYAKAQKEVLTKQENEIKQHFGISQDLKGLDLVQAVIKEKTKAVEQKEITPDEIKRSDVYLNMVNKMNEDSESKISEVTNQFTTQINDYKKKETFKTIYSAADVVINKLNPVFSKEPAIAQNQRKMIHSALESKKFEVKDNGRIIPLNKEDGILENEHGHPVEFDSIVTSITKGLFDLNTSQERNSPGSNDNSQNPEDKKEWTGTTPANDAEYMKMISEASSIEEKKAITEAYEKTE